MNQFMGINSIHLNYLDPLLKWKILDIKALLNLSICQSRYNSFTKVIAKMQSIGLLGSIVDPVSKKKYVYFTDEGIKIKGGSNKLLIANEDSPEHDAKASEIARKFLELGYAERVFLEHEFYSKNKVIPDALILGSKNGRNFSIALEFELNRKSKARVIGKIKSYFTSTDFDYVMYFFTTDSLMRSYEKFIREELGQKYLDRVMFISHPATMWEKFSLPSTEVWFKGERKSLDEIFS